MRALEFKIQGKRQRRHQETTTLRRHVETRGTNLKRSKLIEEKLKRSDEERV